MLRSAILIVLLISGCSNGHNVLDSSKVSEMGSVSINGFSFDPSSDYQTGRAYRGQWEHAEYWVHTPSHWIGMSGILQAVRSKWPEREYYTTKPKSWPTSSIQGVLRGPSTGVSQAQFQIEAQAGIIFITFFSENDDIDETYIGLAEKVN